MFPDPLSQNAEAYQWCKGFCWTEKPAGDKMEQGCDVLSGVWEGSLDSAWLLVGWFSLLAAITPGAQDQVDIGINTTIWRP